jgi:putative (di)nucleoside polyphosphate hydrolase
MAPVAFMTDLIDTDGFRANVGIVLIHGDGRVFLGSRPGGRGWQFPQGGILRNEKPEEALFRELKEEIGLESTDVRIAAATRGWLRYRLPRQYQRRQSGSVCIGQKQRWFMLHMLSGDDRVRFDSTSAPEFEEWRWVDYWLPVREVIYFKRAVYARALEELGRTAFAARGLPPLPEWWEEEKHLRKLGRQPRNEDGRNEDAATPKA